MDTKSTRIQNDRKLKLALIVLSCIFSFLSIFFLQKIYEVYRYDYNIFEIGISDITSTPSILGDGYTDFANAVKSDTSKVAMLCTKYISDEAVESGTSFESQEAAIRKIYESEVKKSILNAKLDEIEDLYVYNEEKGCYEYPFAPIDESLILKNFSSDDQIRADSRDGYRGTTTVNGVEYYKGYPIDEVKVDEAAIRNEVEASMESEIIAARSQFRMDYENIKSHLASLRNFQYYFVNRENGMVYTNMDVSSVQEASKDMSGYAISLINGDLRVSEEISTASGTEDYAYYNDDMYYLSDRLSNYVGIINSDFDLSEFDAYIHANMSAEDLFEDDAYVEIVIEYENAISGITENSIAFLVSFALWLACLVFLVSIAGRIDTNGRIVFTAFDKLPNSIHFILSSLLVGGLIAISLMIYFDIIESHNDFNRVLISLIFVMADILFIEWIMSVSRQIKSGQLLSNTIIYYLVIRNFHRIRAWWESDENKFVNATLRRKVFMPLILYVILIIPLSIWSYAMLIPWGDGAGWLGVIAAVVLTVVTFVYLVKLTAGFDNINAALSDAASGNFEYKVSLERMPVVIRPMAENVNMLTDSIKVAIDDAVKGERMKTELITNVSHDLKTPLTSIITYTDLLKRCNIEDDQALEYIGVLDEKSARLRRLIDDLVEASKASTGNVTLLMTKLNINEMVEQVFGEYEDLLAELELDLRYTTPEAPVFVVADGQKTYRVIENLFSNVKKYAMPGTRVYLDVTTDERFAVISMKNISKDEMDFDVSRLTDRFVRGDESRSTEGSGLGLSIAKSLTELQGGKFEIGVDGDLFKVVIKIPKSTL